MIFIVKSRNVDNDYRLNDFAINWLNGMNDCGYSIDVYTENEKYDYIKLYRQNDLLDLLNNVGKFTMLASSGYCDHNGNDIPVIVFDMEDK